MDLIDILAQVILITTIGTMVFGVGAYAAFKLRDRRQPGNSRSDETMNAGGPLEPVFLERYVPGVTTDPAAQPVPDDR